MKMEKIPAILGVAQMKHKMAALGLAEVRVKADATNPNALFEQVNAAVAAMRAEMATQINGKADDVVTNQKIDRINAAITEMLAAQDAVNRQMEAAKLAQQGGRIVPDAQYSTKFMDYIRGESPDLKVLASVNRTNNGDGGFLVPTEWDRSITDKLVEYGSMRDIATVITTGRAAYTGLANLRGTASGWVGEMAPRPETATATFAPIPFFFGQLYANPAATQDMIDDAEFDLEAWMADQIALEFLRAEGTAFVAGTGANQPAGLLTYATGGTRAATNPLGAIEVINSGAAAAITNADALLDLVGRLPTMFRGGAQFAMNRQTESAVRKLKDPQGAFLWQAGLAAGTPATLLGYPVRELPEMPNVAANALPICFGNFAQGYHVIERRNTTVLRDPFSNKPMVHFYTTKRVGGGVANPEALKLLRCAV
jgi:HK97 family phage major capsid protein